MSDNEAGSSKIVEIPALAALRQQDGEDPIAEDVELVSSTQEQPQPEDDHVDQAFEMRSAFMTAYLQRPCETPPPFKLWYISKADVRSQHLQYFCKNVHQICAEIIQPTIKTGLNTLHLIQFLSKTADYIESSFESTLSVLNNTVRQRALYEEINYNLKRHSSVSSTAGQESDPTDISDLATCIDRKQEYTLIHRRMIKVMLDTVRYMTTAAGKMCAIQRRFSPQGLARTDRGWALLLLHHAIDLEQQYAVLRLLHSRIHRLEDCIVALDNFLASLRIEAVEEGDTDDEAKMTTFTILGFAQYLREKRQAGKFHAVHFLLVGSDEEEEEEEEEEGKSGSCGDEGESGEELEEAFQALVLEDALERELEHV